MVHALQVSVYLSIVAVQFIFVQKLEVTLLEVKVLLESFVLILASEFAVDWIKHAFIIKFNRISPSVYRSYISILCADARRSPDAAAAKAPHVATAAGSPGEYSAPVVARMGFVPIPLLCLVVRVLGHDVLPRLYFGHPSGWLVCFLVWLVLCLVKVLTSLLLLGHACTHSGEQPGGRSQLYSVERFSLHGKRIV